MKKYFHVGYLEHYKGDDILYEDINNIIMLHQGGDITSRSRGYGTLEELMKEEGITNEPCRICGGVVKTNWLGDVKRLIDNNICFGCDHWQEKVKVIGQPQYFVIDGAWYTDGGRKSADYQGFMGFGGAEFEIETFDGRKVSTNNLWWGGKITKWFKDKLPDNARFVKPKSFKL